MAQLEIVAGSLPEPPYPADVRANGWHFQLDTTRMRSSDTWTLARAEMRPWLLMLWVIAWEETPCGTLPADDDLVIAKLQIDPGLFQGHRAILVRHWRRHSDGRLYHHVVTEHVLSMCDSRRKDADRVRRWRDGQSERNALVTRNQRVSNGTGSGSGSGSGSGEVLKPLPASPAARAPGKGSKVEKSKATRLPADWSLPDDWRDWAVRVHKLEPQRCVRISLVFRDYWHSKPKDATRLDWFATWRNWIRKECGNA